MSKSSNSSTPDDCALADAIGRAGSLASSRTDGASDSAPCSDSPVQRLGKFSIPVQGWSLLQVDPPDGVILWVGVVQLRVLAAGKWEPEEPEQYLPQPPEPPQPMPGEPHLAYAQRYLRWSQPARLNPQWQKWRALKAWTGQSADDLRAAIESDQSLDNPSFFINPQPQ